MKIYILVLSERVTVAFPIRWTFQELIPMEGLATLVLGAFTGERLSVGRNIARIVRPQTGSKW